MIKRIANWLMLAIAVTSFVLCGTVILLGYKFTEHLHDRMSLSEVVHERINECLNTISLENASEKVRCIQVIEKMYAQNKEELNEK